MLSVVILIIILYTTRAGAGALAHRPNLRIVRIVRICVQRGQKSNCAKVYMPSVLIIVRWKLQMDAVLSAVLGVVLM